MPTVRGNDVVTINGQRLNKQGIGRIRDGVATELAASTTKNNGLDEMIVGFVGADGKTERMLIWGDNLDFSFRNLNTEPDIRVNGEPGVLVHFDDEQNTFLEGGLHGVAAGIKDAFDSIATLAKHSVEGVAVAGGAAFLGGAAWMVASGGKAFGTIVDAIIVIGPKVAGAAGVIGGSAVGLIVLAGIVRGAFGVFNKDIKMETIAAVVEDHPRRQLPARPVRPARPESNDVTPEPTPQAAPQAPRVPAKAQSAPRAAAPAAPRPLVKRTPVQDAR